MAPADDPHDGRLFERASEGDDSALASLIESYLPRLRGFVRVHLSPDLRRRESCDDIVQSVCRELAEREACLRFTTEADFRGWLFTSALTKVRQKGRFHRQARRDVGREHRADTGGRDALLARAYESAESPSGQAIGREYAERFEAALDGLNEDHREVIALARIAGLPHDVVAERMGRSVNATRQLLGRALLRLADKLRVMGE